MSVYMHAIKIPSSILRLNYTSILHLDMHFILLSFGASRKHAPDLSVYSVLEPSRLAELAMYNLFSRSYFFTGNGFRKCILIN